MPDVLSDLHIVLRWLLCHAVRTVYSDFTVRKQTCDLMKGEPF
ncbi:rCG37925 [Rattus norvegicus]|uniref:RCG37925 n=1 Tax=Rattus norvegicus TaxID=10116 RepID=A6K664_RAT|nr:rCG37925 [Rattus norvegicus]